MSRFQRVRAMLFAACGLALLPISVRGGDLNTEVNNMFNNLGGVGNYTAPGAFRGQAFGTLSGGNVFLRSPNRVYQLTAIQFPNAKGGCGGIDVFGGSFSHLSAAEFKNVLKNITAALPGIAFQLAIDAVAPMLGGITKWAKSLETLINNARINSCETARGLVSNPAETLGYAYQEACATLAVAMGMETDADAARRRCATDRPAVLAAARTSADPDVRDRAPFVGNVMWKALQRVTGIDDEERLLIMSIVGTVVYFPEEQRRDPDIRDGTLTSIARLLYGQSDAGGGKVNVHMLTCNNFTDCDVVGDNPTYLLEPFTTKVERLMGQISTAIATRAAIPNNSTAVGFVNTTSEPVYRMLSVGNAIPGSGLALSLITQYRDVIAADYAYNFLERNLRTGLSALAKTYVLEGEKAKDVEQIRLRARDMLQQLAAEKTVLYGRQQSFETVAGHLERLERQLRAQMPQHVMDMLGQRPAYAMK